MRASSSFRKQTILVRVPIFLYVAQEVERVPAVSFGTHNSHNRQTSMPRWDSHLQSQQARGCRPIIGVFIYIFIRLKTFSEGNCSACKFEGCAWDPGWFCSCLVSGMGWGSDKLLENVQL